MSQRLKLTLNCKSCGAEFHPIAGRAKTHVYCSPTCRDNGLRRPIREMSETDVAWLAGLFDGEGHVGNGVTLSQRARGVKIQVTNTSRELLDRIVAVTAVGYITMRPRTNPNWKTTYDWHTTGGNARQLLQAMLPYLIAKREAAARAIA